MSKRASAKDIFLRAVELATTSERAGLLDEACGADLLLRQQVESLLFAHDRPEDLLDKPAVSADNGPLSAGPAAVAERPGMRIGPYELLEQIGEGGMGVVYMAQQHAPVKRHVALKIIKPGMDTRQVIARFETERQALSLMDHPNIAKVFDAGATDSGRPYFVMEPVQGVTITQYSDQRQLSPRERLELFIPVCHAIQHAHHKGIIHRDLKPSNVLVAEYDDRPVPKIIDFGVAKAIGQRLTGETVLTEIGQVVGTVEYMSPEQAKLNKLDIDTRTDIYSLGVLLYELLTGETPFDRQRLRSAAFDEMLRIIREEEPPRPSTKLSSSQSLPSIAAKRQMEPRRLTKLLHGELDWMLLKCLEKDRVRRYESASGLALDIQRYLNDEPVQAGPPSPGYRFRLFLRRNRAWLAAVTVALVALVFALAAVSASIGWAARDRAARQFASEQLAAQALAQSEQHMRAKSWPQALAEARRAETALAHVATGHPLRWKIDQWLKDLEMVARLDQIRLAQSATTDETFDYAATDAAYAEAFREFGIDLDRLDPDGSAAMIRKHLVSEELAVALDHWASDQRILKKSEDSWRRLVQVARLVDDDPVRSELRDFWGRPMSEELTSRLTTLAKSCDANQLSATTLQLLAQTLRRVRLFDQELAVLQQAQRRYPADFWLNFYLAYALSHQPVPDWDSAIRYYSVAVGLRSDCAMAYSNLGYVLGGDGQFAEAIACFRKGVALNPKLAIAHINLGHALNEQGLFDEAVTHFERAMEMDPTLGSPHNGLGFGLWKRGRINEAIASYRRAIELNPKLALAHSNLGVALRDQGKLDESLIHFHQSIELDPRLAQPHLGLGIALSRKGLRPEAIAAYQEALRLKPDYGQAYFNLGVAHFLQGDWEQGVANYRQAVKFEPQSVHFRKMLGNALKNNGRLGEAIGAYREAVRLKPEDASLHIWLAWHLTSSSDPSLRDAQLAAMHATKATELNPKNPNAWGNLGAAHYRDGRWLEALKAFEEANRRGDDFPHRFFLAMTYRQLGRKVEARRAYDEGERWRLRSAAHVKEQKLLRAEAAQLLGLEPPSD